MPAFWTLVLLVALGLQLSCTAVDARNTHGTPDPAQESGAWWGDRHGAVVMDGCLHGTSGTTSASIPSCRAYAMLTSPAPPQLRYLEEPSARTITYSGGDNTYWLGGRANTTVIPAGWTCLPAQGHYCWIASATLPTLPNGVTWLARVTVAGGAITAVADISQRVLTKPLTLTTNLTTAPPGRWTMLPGALVTLDPGVTLTMGGCLEAGVYRLFTGTGLVRWGAGSPCTTVRPEWWGGLGDGTTPNQVVFLQAASDALEFSGGTVLGAGPGAHYLFATTPISWDIRHSNITWDGQGALLSSGTAGTTRIRAWDGAGQAESGETAQFLHNVHLKNYRIGTDSTFPANQMRGGALFGCVNCSITNVVVQLSRGTAFTLHRCQGCTLRDLRIEHGNDQALEGFCTLVLHSNHTLVENWTCTGNIAGTSGPCCEAALQMKGGSQNRVVNAHVERAKNPGGLNHAFFQRGDSPWQFSGTDPEATPYPFPTLTIGEVVNDCKVVNCYELFPDARRASVDTQWTTISVKDVDLEPPGLGAKCMGLQETQGDVITNFIGNGCRLGIVFAQSPKSGAGERNFTLTGFHLNNIGVDAPNGDGLLGISVLGAGADHPDGEAIGATNFRDIHISHGRINGVAGIGIRIISATNVTVEDVTVVNAALEVSNPDPRFAIQVTGYSTAIKLIGNHVLDNQPTPSITAGIRIGENVVSSTVLGNSVRCNNCVFGTFFPIQNLTVGQSGQNDPGDCTMRTVGATLSDFERCRILTHPGDVFKDTISCAAYQGFTNQAYYERAVIVTNNAGTVTVIPNTGTGDITMESDATWDVVGASSDNDFRWRVQGGVGQTVDWICNHDIIPLVAAAAPPP